MSKYLMPAVLLLATAGESWAADPKGALAIIERAIQAHGGEAALNRAQTRQRTSSGVMVLASEEVPFTDELTMQLPNRLRWSVETGTGARKAALTVVINGEKGWQITGGAATDLSKERLQEMRDELQVLWLATLTPLKVLQEANSVTLDVLPAIKVADRPAVGVKILRQSQADVRLYFDRETALLTKVEREAKSAGQLVPRASVLLEYKEFGGVKLPVMQIELTGGKKTSEVKDARYRLLDKVDDSVFAKP